MIGVGGGCDDGVSDERDGDGTHGTGESEPPSSLTGIDTVSDVRLGLCNSMKNIIYFQRFAYLISISSRDI